MGYIFWIVIFLLDVWAIASIINTDEPMRTKVIWIAMVAILPLIGLIAWWIAGPKANYRMKG